jgi:hypothetical protein
MASRKPQKNSLFIRRVSADDFVFKKLLATKGNNYVDLHCVDSIYMHLNL